MCGGGEGVDGGGGVKYQKMGWWERGMSGAEPPSSRDGRFLLFSAARPHGNKESSKVHV